MVLRLIVELGFKGLDNKDGLCIMFIKMDRVANGPGSAIRIYSWAFSEYPTLKVVIPRILSVKGVSRPTEGLTGIYLIKS